MAAQAGPAFKRLRVDLPTEIEGRPLREQIYNEENNPNLHAPYHKLTVACPLSSCRHCSDLPCSKSRVLGDAQCQNFGRIEVVGFLGRWLQKAPDFPSRAAHMRYRPSVAEVEAYLQEKDLL